MPRAAVIGSPIAHSLSPDMHNAGYAAQGLDSWTYHRFDVDEAGFGDFISRLPVDAPDITGLSVTMPLKFRALDFADEVTPRAALIGSANTLVQMGDAGSRPLWRADNTDCDGVVGALRTLDLQANEDDSAPRKAVLIGAGGTARPALWALAQEGFAHVTVLNRSDRSAEFKELIDALGITVDFQQLNSEATERLRELALGADVLVSTVPSAALAGCERALAHTKVFDVIYHPWPTPLIKQAAANGYRTAGGHTMLLHQGVQQFEQFTGHTAPVSAMEAALHRALQLR